MEKHKFIERMTKECCVTKENLEKVTKRMLKVKNEIKALDESQELNIPYLKKVVEKGGAEIDRCNEDIKRISSLSFLGEQVDDWRDTIVWFEYLQIKDKFQVVLDDFQNFLKQYRNFVPKNSEALNQKVIKYLDKKGYIVDSSFEGDYATWIGVYARPKDKPTYLDPANEKDAELQARYQRNGFKQDFAEWFDFKIDKKGEITEDI